MNIIVAYCKNRGIGMANKLPWRSLKDLEHFKRLTIGDGDNAVIMGRKTWDSLPKQFKPLPKRVNIILSRNSELNYSDEVHIFSDISLAKQFCKNQKYDQVWIIGGQNIYKQFITDKEVENIYVTNIDRTFHCDTFFPPFKNRFKLKWQSDLYVEKNLVLRFQHFISNTKK